MKEKRTEPEKERDEVHHRGTEGEEREKKVSHNSATRRLISSSATNTAPSPAFANPIPGPGYLIQIQSSSFSESSSGERAKGRPCAARIGTFAGEAQGPGQWPGLHWIFFAK